MRFMIRFALVGLIAGAGMGLACQAARADDDPLPNFNAPQDNSPLNVDKVNRVLGITMFKDPLLWEEDDRAVAQRLGWPEESRTSTQSSYRLYTTEKNPMKILGARAYSCVLYAINAKPTEISIVFVNEGDYEWTQNILTAAQRLKSHDDSTPVADTAASANSDTSLPTNSPPDAVPQHSTANTSDEIDDLRSLSDGDRFHIGRDVHDAFEKALKQDAQTITDAMTTLFGQPVHEGFGGGSETRERVMRWDWQGHAFLLSTPKDQYVTLRIVPVAFADNYGHADTIARDDLKTLLLQRVKHADSGDVVVTEIPMVDQGPKGYCVPATWERYLRYLGIPADMYVLAMAAGSSQEGTNLDAMVENVDSLVTLYHRRIDNFSGDLDMKMISQNIDNGLNSYSIRKGHFGTKKRAGPGHRLERMGREASGPGCSRNPCRDRRHTLGRRPSADDYRLQCQDQ
jgi:hypothetical protein